MSFTSPPVKRFCTIRELAAVARYEWRARQAWTGPLSAARGFWWVFVRRYAYEICTCGRPVAHNIGGAYWHASDQLWSAVAGWEGWESDMGELAYLGPAGTLCPTCFTLRAEALGIRVFWRCEPAATNPNEEL